MEVKWKAALLRVALQKVVLQKVVLQAVPLQQKCLRVALQAAPLQQKCLRVALQAAPLLNKPTTQFFQLFLSSFNLLTAGNLTTPQLPTYLSGQRLNPHPYAC